MTQHQKIINLCIDGKYHCQNEFRDNFIFSPHKRRNEIAGKKRESDPATGEWDFDKRKCEHDVAGQFDYIMFKNPKWIDPKTKVSFRVLTSQEVEAQYAKLNL